MNDERRSWPCIYYRSDDRNDTCSVVGLDIALQTFAEIEKVVLRVR